MSWNWLKNFFTALGILTADHGGTGNQTNTANGVMVGNGTDALTVTAEGATNTVLHGNTGADPSFSAVVLTADVSGILPSANGGTGINNAGTITVATSITVTGGGTIALGGFTFTVPATGTAALLGTANVFTVPQVVTGSTDAVQLTINANPAAQTANVFELRDTSGALNTYGKNNGDFFTYTFRANKFEANGWNAIESGAAGGYGMGSGNMLTWASGASTTTVAGGDTGLMRSAAGVVKLTDGSTGIRGLIGGGTTVASNTAMPLPTGRVFHVSGTTNITSITATNLQAGVVITLIFDDVLTFTDGNNLKLAGNFVTTADDTITLAFDGTNFYECSRSIN